jgi:hypothetical protein
MEPSVGCERASCESDLEEPGMSLPIVAFGIALTVAAVHFTGGSKFAVIADSDHARALFLADFPEEHPQEPHLTGDRRSAFMDLPGQRVAIVQSFGDGFFTRIVSYSDVAAIRLRDPGIVSIRFKDFTWTGGHFTFEDQGSAAAVHAALNPSKNAVATGA